jgi:hypothetical protein
LRFRKPAGEGSLGDAYAKVIAKADKDSSSFRIRFTSLSPEVKKLLEGLRA